MKGSTSRSLVLCICVIAVSKKGTADSTRKMLMERSRCHVGVIFELGFGGSSAVSGGAVCQSSLVVTVGEAGL